MDPISALLIGGAVAGAAGGIGQGLSTRAQGKAMALTPEEEAELKRLQARRRQGGLGLTGGQRTTMEQRFLAEQAGQQRELEAAALQQAAARGLGGSISGRDIFMQEMAQAQGEAALRGQQAQLISQADREARAEQQARIAELQAQQQQADALKRAGTIQAVTGGLAGGGQVALTAAQMQQQTKMAEASVPRQTDQTLMNMYYGGQQPTYTFGGLLPPPTFQ